MKNWQEAELVELSIKSTFSDKLGTDIDGYVPGADSATRGSDIDESGDVREGHRQTNG